MIKRLEPEIDQESKGVGPDSGEGASIAEQPASGVRSPSRSVPTLGSVVLLLTCLAIFLWTGFRGLDFGLHWDESPYQVKPVKTMLRTGILLPQTYTYPSFDFWLNLGVATPEIVREVREAKAALPTRDETVAMFRRASARSIAALDQPAYRMRLRTTYLAITALTVLWVYLTVLVWAGTPIQAVFAAALIGTSWRWRTIRRWVASDCIMMQFGALTILLASLAARRPNGAKWLVPAAIAAGLATGTKYTAGTLLLPIFIAAYVARDRLPAGESAIRMVAKILVAFAVTFVVTTPGAVIEPIRFIRDARHEIVHYSQLGHSNYTVSPGLSHALKLLEYMGLVVFSPYAVFAGFFFLLAILGTYVLLRQSGMAALIVLAFPIVNLGLMTNMRAMIVRNDMASVPPIAVLASFGLAWLYRRLGAKPLRLGLACVILGGLITNEAWLIWSSQTIVDRPSGRFLVEAAHYLRSNPGTNFYLSPKVRAMLQPQGVVDLPNVTADPARSTLSFVCNDSMPHMTGPANYRNLSHGWFGPYEVNWDYYTTWRGDDRIVIMDTARAIAVRMVPIQSKP